MSCDLSPISACAWKGWVGRRRTQVTTAAECDAQSDCHSVYHDPHNCKCATSGCCAAFYVCATGGKAQCTGSPTCGAATPYCESPYVLSYTSFEGCVLPAECAQ